MHGIAAQAADARVQAKGDRIAAFGVQHFGDGVQRPAAQHECSLIKLQAGRGLNVIARFCH
jgi:hypothetical protein